MPAPRRLLASLARSLLGSVLAFSAAGCASITGLATGAATGLVDGPSQVAREDEQLFQDHPELWAPNVLVIGPASVVLGPLFGLVKGIAVDVRWLRGETTYGEAFGGYRDASIWRPYTLHFPR